ncbi:hypothetical protein RCL1_008160 [Eukaryota sp. TZLM3-RCL]
MPFLLRTNEQGLHKFVIADRSGTIFGWLDLIITGQLPFNTVAKKNYRLYSKLKSISRNTLMKYAILVHEAVRKKIAGLLSESFGLVLDLWEEQHSSVHYLGIFANVFFQRDLLLLDMVPFIIFEDELAAVSSNDTLFGAQQIVQLIDRSLAKYEKTIRNVKFLVADNCSTNHAVGRLLGVNVIGCASHRFELQVKHCLHDQESLLEKMNKLMSKLSTLKRTLILNSNGLPTPLLRKKTRWSSTRDFVE